MATAWFDTEIDIKKLVWTCYGELDPTTFAAAKFRVGKSKARALVFSSGKIVCTGATSIADLFLSVQQLQILVNKIHPKVQCLNICVQNIVSSAYVGGTIDNARSQAELGRLHYASAVRLEMLCLSG